jgi:predicted nucleic acid-binding protein
MVRMEDETAALRDWLGERPEQPVVSSELGRVEVLRAARRVGGRALTEARAVVGDIDLVPLDRAVQDLASDIGDPLLRTLDALHLASAVLLSDALTVFIAYDQRLTSAAQAAGLVVATPRGSPDAVRPDPRLATKWGPKDVTRAVG